jgi:hypothetical protein
MVDLLMVVMLIGAITSFMLTSFGKAQRSLRLTNVTQEFTAHLKQAQVDSKKLHATTAAQMAQITILNDRYYMVVRDTNDDGKLDPPMVVGLEDRRVRMNGPFPRTVMFDWLGRAVDADQKVLPSPSVTFTSEAGKITIPLADTTTK